MESDLNTKLPGICLKLLDTILRAPSLPKWRFVEMIEAKPPGFYTCPFVFTPGPV